MKLFHKIAVLGLAVAALACNKTVSDDYDAREQRSFDIWMAQNYPEVTEQLDNGMYVQWFRKGTGSATLKDEKDWMVLDALIKDIDGNVILTRDSMVAKREGTFSRITHYVPRFALFNTKATTFTEGENEALSMMTKGDSVRIFLPSMLAYNYVSPDYSTGFEGWYYSSINPKNGGSYGATTGKPVIMDLALRDIISDPEAAELAEVKARATQLGYGTDADTIRPGLYFTFLDEDEESVKLTEDSTTYIRYVIRFLDGKLMTTNVDSIALDEWGDYGDKYFDSKLSAYSGKGTGSSPVVSAVTEVLKSGKARYNSTMQMVFTSDWGFGTSGKAFVSTMDSYGSGRIPNAMVYPYTPLIMEMTTMKYGFSPTGDEDDEEEDDE